MKYETPTIGVASATRSLILSAVGSKDGGSCKDSGNTGAGSSGSAYEVDE